MRLLIHPEVASPDGKDSAGVATHSLMLAASTLAQYRSELRSTPDNVDWLGVLALANEVVRGGQALVVPMTEQGRCRGLRSPTN